VNVYATDRNSDDQCLIIKNLFNDTSFVRKYNISAMNSINFVRIASQICYYFYCYLRLIPHVDRCIDFAVPSGAFGNSCAASFAKAMGLPIRYIIPCCNENNIVFRTLKFGDFSSSFSKYHLTKSPAMDVQIAYNIERFFWLCFHGNGPMVKRVMNRFERDAQSMEFEYHFDAVLRRQFRKYISESYCVSDAQIKDITRHFVTEHGYVACPHSACSLFGAFHFGNDQTRSREDREADVPMVAIATAHPAKFPNIIRGFFEEKEIEDLKVRGVLEEALKHPFLPKDGDKEECIALTSDHAPGTTDKWSQRWTQRLRADIEGANRGATRSKL